MSDVAITFENISKQYRLGLVSTRTLSHDLKRWWVVNMQGKEDPYLQIGETNDRSSKGSSEYVWALRNIDFEIKKGEVLGIIGKNGAGKSTLLKILSRVTSPTTGRIRAYGRIASLLEVGTGFHGELTGRENIFMNGAIMGMTIPEIKRKFDEIVDFAGVERYIDTPVKRYSSGMIVRLGFAVAAHLEPEILVVDEVLAVGDAEFQKKAIGKMQDVSSKDGRTLLFVSHNMAAVKSLCTSAIVLSKGKFQFSGTVDKAVENYLSQSVYTSPTRKNIQSKCGRFSLKMPYWVDENGNTVSIFGYGDKKFLRFEFEFNQPVRKINPGFAIETFDGIRMLTSHLADDETFLRKNPYSGKVIMQTEFDLTTLAPGNYNVIIGVRDEFDHTVIYSDTEIGLEIGQIRSVNGGYGLLWHPTRWTIL